METDKKISLKKEINIKRNVWRKVRTERLNRKNEMIQNGYNKNSIRKDKAFKKLKKEQKRLSNEIRHLEIKLNRHNSKKYM